LKIDVYILDDADGNTLLQMAEPQTGEHRFCRSE